MLANIAGIDLPIVLLIALVVIFGGSQLPKIAKNVGSAGREFRKAQREAEEEDEAKKQAAVTAAPAVAAVPVAPAPVAPVAQAAPEAAPSAAPADDKVTISKAELAALLDERLGKPTSSSN
jgi:TatA/E family protein of Tat protein translocase